MNPTSKNILVKVFDRRSKSLGSKAVVNSCPFIVKTWVSYCMLVKACLVSIMVSSENSQEHDFYIQDQAPVFYIADIILYTLFN